MSGKLRRKLDIGWGIVCLACLLGIGIYSFEQRAIAETSGIAQKLSTVPMNFDVLELMKPQLPALSSNLLLEELNDNRVTHLVLSISERHVYAYQDDRILKKFPVAVGKNGWETPTGEFKVLRMIRNPAWQSPWTGAVIPPAEDNPLGLRWIGFWTDGKDTIGFHGTPNESSIGQAASHGCVRMTNRDIVALFELVEVGMTVKVIP